MRKCFIIVALISLVSLPALAQSDTTKADKYGWKKSLLANLNLTQNHFDNWAEGGESSFAWQFSILGKYNNIQPHYTWKNSLKLEYGRTQLSDKASRKSADEINFESVFTYLLNIYVNPYVSLTAKTQFYNGYKYAEDESRVQVSKFFDPGYITQSIGFGYEPFEELTTRLGFAAKETFADEFAALYSDDPETPDEIETVRVELGLQSTTELNVALHENIALGSKLNIFTTLQEEPLAITGEEELNVDVDWDTSISGKVTELVNVNLNVRVFYDGQISPKRQIKQVLSVGFSYVVL